VVSFGVQDVDQRSADRHGPGWSPSRSRWWEGLRGEGPAPLQPPLVLADLVRAEAAQVPVVEPQASVHAVTGEHGVDLGPYLRQARRGRQVGQG
jgi:hypothetical protein